MDIIRFTSTLKPSGKEYKKVVYWNRFVRTKLETIILLIMFLGGIALFAYALTANKLMLMIVGAILFLYPIIIISQCNSSIKYHLAHRDKVEEMPCEFTIMQNGILAEVKEAEYTNFLKWEDATKLYNAIGYYMFFDNNNLKLMIKKADIPDSQKKLAIEYIRTGMK